MDCWVTGLLRIQNECRGRGWVEIGVFVELDVIHAASPVEDLDIDLAFGQGGRVQPYNGQDTLDNLSLDYRRLVQTRAHNKNVDAEI